MILYILVYIYIAFLALFVKEDKFQKIFKILLFCILVLVIGFRYEVGGDWFSYLQHYQMLYHKNFNEIFKYGFDPGHAFINWIMGEYNLGIYGVNFIYALIFTIGLFLFSAQQPDPLLTLTVAFPYLILVVAMGYSRQAVAIGFFMIALIEIEKQNFWAYVFWILMASLFHKTALILLPFGLFIRKEKTPLWLYVLILVPTLYGAWNLFLAPHFEHLWNVYVERQRQSSGALIRVMMNLIPAILFLISRKKWEKIYEQEYKFWFWISIASIGAFVLLPLIDSTVIDRLSLYFIPLQIVVYSRLPYLYKDTISPKTFKLFIVIFYFVVMMVWLNFASHADEWIPYKNFLIESVF